MNKPDAKRRRFLKLAAISSAVFVLPLRAEEPSGELKSIAESLFPGKRLQPGRISLTTPPLSENGYSVPLKLHIESSMTATEYVRKCWLIAEKNPEPRVACFDFTPDSGEALVETRIRLGDTQHVTALAEFNDGSVFYTQAFAIVTLAACTV